LIVAWTLGILSNVGKFSFIDIFRTFRKTASPSWSWISSNCSDSDCVGAAGPFREGLGLSSSRLLILSGRTALDQLMDGLSQAIPVRNTSLPTPPRLIRCRRTLEYGGPESRISIDSVGRLLTSISSTRVSSSPIRNLPLVADEEPVASLMTLWLPSLSLTDLSPIHPFVGMSGLPGSSSVISSSSSWSSGRVRSVTSSESSPDEVPWAGRSSTTSSAGLADGNPGSCDSHTAAPYVVVVASLKDRSPGLRACPSIWKVYNLPWSVVVVLNPASRSRGT